MILVIDRKGSTIWHENGCLLVVQPGSGKRRFPVTQLQQVILYGNPTLEAGACRALAVAGVPLLLLPTRGHDGVAMLGQGLATQLPLRRMQHRCADRPDAALAMACWIVQTKLHSYDLPLARFASDSAAAAPCSNFIKQRDAAVEKLAQAASIAALSGIEGSVARAWFALLAQQLPAPWKFEGRNRRPPRDPVNAMLSLGYTLLHSVLRQAAIAAGFDPSLGFLHQQYPGREAMVLDLIEPFRAGVDDFVLELLATGQLQPQNFHYRDDTGCRLNKQARPVFYTAWAERLEHWPVTHTETEQAEPAQTPLREQAGGLIRRAREQFRNRVPDHD